MDDYLEFMRMEAKLKGTAEQRSDYAKWRLETMNDEKQIESFHKLFDNIFGEGAFLGERSNHHVTRSVSIYIHKVEYKKAIEFEEVTFNQGWFKPYWEQYKEKGQAGWPDFASWMTYCINADIIEQWHKFYDTKFGKKKFLQLVKYTRLNICQDNRISAYLAKIKKDENLV